MKIRILSDLHLDVNSGYSLRLKDKDVFTILAGDTSGDPDITKKWVEKNVKSGIIISGNHLVYNHKKLTVQDLRNSMSQLFPIDGDVSYLDVECGVWEKVVNGILFIGTTMYTNFTYVQDGYYSDKLSDEEVRKINMYNSARSMNDYRYGIIDKDVRMQPSDYVKWYENAKKRIQESVERNESLENPLPVILITHHCLSPQCISSEYVDSELNSSYITDEEEFIKSHPSIKLVVSGHVHGQRIFDIERDDGSKCKYILNPRGYCVRCEDMGFNENTFIDTDTWEVEITPKSKSRRDRERKRLNAAMSRLSWFF